MNKTFLNDDSSDFFKSFYQKVYPCTCENTLIDQCISLLSQLNVSLADFPNIQNNYSRNIVFKDSVSKFEMLFIRWNEKALTPIHGHPDLMFLYFLEGEFEIKNYQRVDQKIRLDQTQHYQAKDHIFKRGKKNQFDNHIHQIFSKFEGLSFHLYSDDALKGQKFV